MSPRAGQRRPGGDESERSEPHQDVRSGCPSALNGPQWQPLRPALELVFVVSARYACSRRRGCRGRQTDRHPFQRGNAGGAWNRGRPPTARTKSRRPTSSHARPAPVIANCASCESYRAASSPMSPDVKSITPTRRAADTIECCASGSSSRMRLNTRAEPARAARARSPGRSSARGMPHQPGHRSNGLVPWLVGTRPAGR